MFGLLLKKRLFKPSKHFLAFFEVSYKSNNLFHSIENKICNPKNVSVKNSKIPASNYLTKHFSSDVLFKNQLNTENSHSKYLCCMSLKFDRCYSNGDNLIKGVDNYLNESFAADKAKQLRNSSKNVLHNVFDVVSSELNRKDLKLNPNYKLTHLSKNKPMWMCTYNLHWPEDIKFSGMASTKQEASHKAALNALLWLRKNNKINEQGRPNLLKTEDILDIKKPQALILKDDEIEKLQNVIDIYHKDLEDVVNDVMKNKSNSEDEQKIKEYENSWPVLENEIKENCLDSLVHKDLKELPISKYRKEIINLINNNRVVIIKGEPGCGKSTRVPQYAIESCIDQNSFCRIIVTQPRRIAAISLTERVANERNENVGDIVGYQVRFQSKFNYNSGKILYCTTGILLRRLQIDPTVKDCSHIILDEAHERDVNTDLLVNLLRHALELNPKLKLIIMSATIDTKIFQDYFKGSAVIHIPGFTYHVKMNFLEDIDKVDLRKTESMCNSQVPYVVTEDVVETIQYIHQTQQEGAILCFLPGWEEISSVKRLLPNTSTMFVLCLHSKLQDVDQKKIFQKPPPGVRKVILATNIAETSVTIDDVVFVIDTGIHKEQRFDSDKGIMCMDNHWISQSSMFQRKGRAGRVSTGISYHLYPKWKYEQFEKYSLPEILRVSLTKIVLDSKVYSNNMNAIEFLKQLPCPPKEDVISLAVDELISLELLDKNENLTPLGRALSDFQLEPKLSKAMVNSVIFNCVTPIVDIITLFSANVEFFTSYLMDKEEIKNIKKESCDDSDHLSVAILFEKWLNYFENRDFNLAKKFCMNNNLNFPKLLTLKRLRELHLEYLYRGLNDILPISDRFSENNELVKGVLLSGVDCLLLHRNWDIVKGRIKRADVFLTRNNHRATITSDSVNYKRKNYSSSFLVYINETRSNVRRIILLRESSIISALTVFLFKTGSLDILEISDQKKSQSITSDDQVILKIKDSNIKVLCNRGNAELIVKCKEVLRSMHQYYIYQLTEGAEYNSNINKSWKNIIENLSATLCDK